MRRQRGALPTFLVIGAFKCGTTSLHHYLGLHPEIQMSAIKETNFFSGPPNGFPYAAGAKRVKRLREYERLFDPALPVRGEASPNYTAYPRREGTAERIKAIVPDVKLIYLVRDPVARTISHYHHRVSTEGEGRSLCDALKNLSDPYSLYTCPSMYAMQIEQYLAHFRQEQMLVVDQADLMNNRTAALREIFSFLSVDSAFASEHFNEEINTREERRTYTSLLVLIRRARATPLQRLPRGLRVAARNVLERTVTRSLPAPVADENVKERLREFYAPDSRRLRALTGKQFSTWSV